MNQINHYYIAALKKRLLSRLSCCRAGLLVLMVMIGAVPASAQALNLQWGVSTEGNGSSALGASSYGVTFDPQGNVYMIGTFQDSTDFDPGPGTAILVPLDFNGSPISPDGTNCFIAKYDVDGNYVWAKAIRGNGFIWGQHSNLISVDGAGNIVIAGAFQDSSDFDPGTGNALLTPKGLLETFIAKYDSSGNYIWANAIGCELDDWASALATDVSGHIYISGTFYDTMDFDPGLVGAPLISAGGEDNFVAKYDGDGNYLWAQRMGSSDANAIENGNGVAVDAHGNVIATGAFQNIASFSGTTSTLTSAGAQNAYITKHDSVGNFLWAINIANVGGYSYGESVAVDKEGYIYASGGFMGPTDFDPGPDTAILTPNGILDGYLAKYDPDGNYLWAIHVGGGYINVFFDVDVDAIGNIYASGLFMGTADFDPGPGPANLTAGAGGNGFVAKYDALTGDYLWAGSLESATSSLSFALAASASGTVYAGGSYSGMVDLDPGPVVDAHTTAVAGDAFLLKLACGDTAATYLNIVECDSSYTLNGETYTSSGTYIQHLPNATHCDSAIVLQLTIQPIALPLITVNGFLLGTTQAYASYQWILNGTPIPGETNSTLLVSQNGDYQVTVTSDEGCEATSAIYTVTNANSIEDINGIGGQINIYPNPASDRIMISSPVEVNAVLFSMEGRQLRYVERVQSISLEGLSDGMYLLQLSDKSGHVLKYEKIVKQLK